MVNDTPAGPKINNTTLSREQGQRIVNICTQAIATQNALMLTLGVNMMDIVNMQVDAVCQMLATIPAAEMRNGVIDEIAAALKGIVGRHVLANATTSGGIIRPANNG